MTAHITEQLAKDIQAYADRSGTKCFVKVNEQKSHLRQSLNLLRFKDGREGCQFEQSFPLSKAQSCHLDFNENGYSLVDFGRYEIDPKEADGQGDLVDHFSVMFKHDGHQILITGIKPH